MIESISAFLATIAGKSAVAAVGVAATTSGLAATGSLPAPAQHLASDVAAAVGVDLPSPDDGDLVSEADISIPSRVQAGPDDDPAGGAGEEDKLDAHPDDDPANEFDDDDAEEAERAAEEAEEAAERQAEEAERAAEEAEEANHVSQRPANEAEEADDD